MCNLFWEINFAVGTYITRQVVHIACKKLLLRYFLILCSCNSWLNVCLLKKPQPVRKSKQKKKHGNHYCTIMFLVNPHTLKVSFQTKFQYWSHHIAGHCLCPSLKGILTLHYIVYVILLPTSRRLVEYWHCETEKHKRAIIMINKQQVGLRMERVKTCYERQCFSRCLNCDVAPFCHISRTFNK